MAEIELQNVTKVFAGDVVAIDDVSLADRRRRVHRARRAVGCGKSTLLRAIAGLEEVTSGEISIGGRDVTDLAPRHRDIAMVFQSYALYPHMSVRQNLGYGLKVRRTPKAEIRRRVDEIAELLGLDGAARAQARAALGRPAPARRDGARDRARAAGVPHGRAALEPRREAPRRHARVARAAPPAARRHDRLRDARPGRGDDARPARRGDAGRPHPAGRHAADALRAAARPLRRRVHRLARDEPRRGDDRRRRGRRSGSSASRSTRARRPERRRGRVDPRHPARDASRTRRSRRPTFRRSRSRSSCSRSSAPTRTSSSASTRRAIAARRRSSEEEDDDASSSPTRLRSSTRASIRERPRASGASLRLAVDPARFHFFDPETGRVAPPRRRAPYATSPAASMARMSLTVLVIDQYRGSDYDAPRDEAGGDARPRARPRSSSSPSATRSRPSAS